MPRVSSLCLLTYGRIGRVCSLEKLEKVVEEIKECQGLKVGSLVETSLLLNTGYSGRRPR
ncbi:MAG: hypothetical protein N3H31_04345 [Candidatus Nezhaarchaeota archaeon]|nr:hypothetical protein [Candidatus Nezhaarchaeota archaeon]